MQHCLDKQNKRKTTDIYDVCVTRSADGDSGILQVWEPVQLPTSQERVLSPIQGIKSEAVSSPLFSVCLICCDESSERILSDPVSQHFFPLFPSLNNNKHKLNKTVTCVSHLVFFLFFLFGIDFEDDALNCFLTQDRSPKTQSQVRRMIEAGQMDQRARHPPSPSSSTLTSPQSPSSNTSSPSPAVEKSEKMS